MKIFVACNKVSLFNNGILNAEILSCAPKLALSYQGHSKAPNQKRHSDYALMKMGLKARKHELTDLILFKS